jgi:predicted transcriptional regulator
MMNAFENKWNARISSLTSSSTNASVDQLLPIFKELTTVCQQFNHQNVQMQKQLDGIVNRVKDVQVKSNNDQTQKPWSQVLTQNGH